MIQCPKCHSTNVIQTDANRYECPYCGNVFTASQAGSYNQGNNNSTYVPGEKKRITAALLALFLGGLGIHFFYLNKPVAGLVFLLLCWTFIPAILAFIIREQSCDIPYVLTTPGLAKSFFAILLTFPPRMLIITVFLFNFAVEKKAERMS